MPQEAQEFLLWARNFTDVAGRNAKAWGLVQADIDNLKADTENYAQVLQITEGDRAAKEDIQLKNTLHTALSSKFKNYVNAEIRCNKAAGNNGRAALGIHVPEGSKTLIHRPDLHIAFSVRPVHSGEHRIDFHVEETGRKAVPYGYNGAVFFIKFLEPDEPVPADISGFFKSDIITRTPHLKEFRSSDRGKRVCYAACWQNGRSEKGPISGIQMHIVP